MLQRFRSRIKTAKQSITREQPQEESNPASRSGSPPNEIVSSGHPTRTTSDNHDEPRVPLAGQRQSTSPQPPLNSLGLHLLHSPKLHAIDIVFVHGLGGHSHRTWTKDRDESLFWPKSWLPFEPGIGVARILTFGYNASWRGPSKSISSITDFAKDLLYDLRFGRDNKGNNFDIGSRPIIFVVHSMGGLVVKKAYLMGLLDNNYKHIVNSVSAMIFLSTPHRGTNLAKSLNRLIAATFQSPKSFISDLEKSSIIIEELNEQFRHIAPSLWIWSFYETMASSIGPRKLMVLEKDTSILGYPGEISKPLDADHQNVCKYRSSTDPNYIGVRNAITSLVTTICSTPNRKFQEGSNAAEIARAGETFNLQEFLGNCITSEDDYNSLRRRWMPKTCGWFLERPEVQMWMEDCKQPTLLWYNAPPASGKSVLAAFVVNQLLSAGKPCQYFLFNHNDERKTSAAASLRALALQMAKEMPEFRQYLSLQSADNLSIESEDPQLIWRNIFDNVLSRTEIAGPLYWVIDALDECNTPKALLECFNGLSQLTVPIRVLVLSRNIDSISTAFNKLSRLLTVQRIEMEAQFHNQADIQVFIEQEIVHMRGSKDFREELKQKILGRSKGNFLWTKLVLDEALHCHTKESIQEVLEEIPDNIFRLYHRMEQNMIKSNRKSNMPLIKALLEWVVCSHRSLNLQELSQTLQPEFPRIIDLRRTIKDTCGQFIQIDEHEKVSMLHHTAQEYFVRNHESRFFIDESRAHEDLCIKTLAALEEPSLRVNLLQQQYFLQSTHPFISYSSISWPYHLGKSEKLSSLPSFDRLVNFLRGPAVLSWICALSLLRRIDVLIEASKVIISLVDWTRRQDAAGELILHRSRDLQLLSQWADDMTKIVGKFGGQLVSSPSIIYDLVPTLSPGRTAIAQHAKRAGSSVLQVLGMETLGWNDNLARLALPSNTPAWGLSCAGKTIAVLGSNGYVQLWDSPGFIKIGSIECRDSISTIALNSTGTKLITYGLTTTKVWTIPHGKLIFSINNPKFTDARVICFANNDDRIIMGGEDRRIRYVLCAEYERGWQLLHPDKLLQEVIHTENLTTSPTRLAFNKDRTLLGASYRGAPLSVWGLSDGYCINKCKRAEDFSSGERRVPGFWSAVKSFTWNPITSHVLGVYRDGCVFKWHPLTDEVSEAQQDVDEIESSPNGKLFATSSSDGTIQVWDFRLLRVIHKLQGSGDLVIGLCFSPNNRRIYDIRAGVVNAWEPDSVVRFNDNKTQLSALNSETKLSTTLSKYSEERISEFEAVTAIGVSPSNSSYCAGYEDGGVFLFSEDDIEGIELLRFYNFLDVTQIIWSPNGRSVAATDLAGEVQIVSVVTEHGRPVVVEPLRQPQFDLRGHSVSSILFSHDGSVLFLTTKKHCFVYSNQHDSIITTHSLDDESDRQWLRHPQYSDLIMACNAQDVTTYNVPGLEVQGTIKLDSALGDEADTQANVEQTIVCQDEQHIILQTAVASTNASARPGITLARLNGISQWPSKASIDNEIVPPEVLCDVYRPLGVLSDGRFIFLNHDLWLCAYTLRAPVNLSEPYQRFYFIPRDWVGINSSRICILDSDGTLYWPRDDYVIRVKCNLNLARSIPAL